jgi:DNA cross-link repair 1C protein
MPLEELVKVLIDAIPLKYKGQTTYDDRMKIETAPDNNLPKVITFPYSRHSSYRELCDLVMAFSPADVYPCTVDELQWHEGSWSPELYSLSTETMC